MTCYRTYDPSSAHRLDELCPACGRPWSEHRRTDTAEGSSNDDDTSIIGAVATAAIAGELLSDTPPDISSADSPAPDFSGGGGEFSGGGASGDF